MGSELKRAFTPMDDAVDELEFEVDGELECLWYGHCPCYNDDEPCCNCGETYGDEHEHEDYSK